MAGADLAGEVSTDTGYVIIEPDGPARFTVAALDLGIKTNTRACSPNAVIRAHVLPSSTSSR